MSIERQALTVFLFFLFLTDCSFAQSDKRIDTLVNWSYDQLYKRVNESFTTEEALIYSNAYLKKAKIEQDTIRICNAFTQIISDTENYNDNIKYCDSIIMLSKNSTSKDYPTWGFLKKGTLLFDKGLYEESLSNYSSAYQALIKHPNDFYLYLLNDQIGQMKIFWGDSYDAIEIFRNQLNIIRSDESLNEINYRLDAIHNITNAFIISKKIDSAQKFNSKGLKLSLKHPESKYYPYFLKQSGEIIFYQGSFKRAKDSLNKSIAINNKAFSLENTYSILGQIELKLNDSISALKNFKKADSIVNINQDFTPETKVIYSFLKDYYLLNGDLDNYKIYKDKLIKTDSILTENYKLVNRKLIQDFEIPKIIIEKDKSIDKLEKNQRRKILPSKVLFVVGTILVIAAFVYIGRIKLQKKKEDPLKDMNPEVVERILKQLKKFEDEKMFTDKKYNLKTISKKFQTNSSYLSRVINARKKNNVSSYLTNLRIDYCIYMLSTNVSYRKYDVKSLAQEFGFNNPTTFSKAFSDRTGTTPAAFIKDI